MYVLGIDASLNGCGYAVIHRDKMIVLECGVIIPKKETKHDLTDGIKLSLIRAKINYLMVKYQLIDLINILNGLFNLKIFYLVYLNMVR